MSVEALSIVLHHSKAKGTAKLVLLGIANHQGDGGAWPSRATLAHYANVSESQVKRALQTLRGIGEVRVDLQAGGTRDTDDHMRPNRYDVLVACPPWCDRTMNHRDTRKRSGRQTSIALPGPVDKPGRTDAPPSTNQGEGGAPTTPGGGAPMRPEPSTEPSDQSPKYVTTDREAVERPPVPASPPADELAAVRDRLASAAADFRKRENQA